MKINNKIKNNLKEDENTDKNKNNEKNNEIFEDKESIKYKNEINLIYKTNKKGKTKYIWRGVCKKQ